MPAASSAPRRSSAINGSSSTTRTQRPARMPRCSPISVLRHALAPARPNLTCSSWVSFSSPGVRSRSARPTQMIAHVDHIVLFTGDGDFVDDYLRHKAGPNMDGYPGKEFICDCCTCGAEDDLRDFSNAADFDIPRGQKGSTVILLPPSWRPPSRSGDIGDPHCRSCTVA
jgi:hypothetical protein